MYLSWLESSAHNRDVGSSNLLIALGNFSFSTRYLIGSLLGEGSFSLVREAKDSVSGEKVAVKIISKQKLKKSKITQNESEILRSLHCDRIVRFIDSYEDLFSVFLVEEFLGYTTLLDYKAESLQETMSILRDVLEALDYIHQHNLVYCDLKPSNVMITDGRAKLIDFGSATTLDGDSINKMNGTIDFFPPEVFNKGKLTPARDIWAFGVLLYYVLTGEYPFYDPSPMNTIENIKHCRYQIPDSISPSLSLIIARTLAPDQDSRPTARELMNHFKV